MSSFQGIGRIVPLFFDCCCIGTYKSNCKPASLCIPHGLHCPRPQITPIVIHSHQIIRMIHHIAIPLNIALSTVIRSNHHTLRTHLPEKVHPAFVPFIPFAVVTLKGMHHHQLYISISRLFFQPQISSPAHISTPRAPPTNYRRTPCSSYSLLNCSSMARFIFCTANSPRCI